MTAAAEDTPGVRRAWGWVEHLRTGGTTAWDDWSGQGPAGGRVLPGAQQLELLRRLNLAGAPSAALVERTVAASAPGRGRPDLELEGSVEPRRFGPPPVDPGHLPDDELLRVAAGLIAEDVVATEPEPVAEPGWARPWRRRYRLLGDPALTAPWRHELVARGRPPGGRGALVLVLGTDLTQMLADVWEHRCFGEGGPSWSRWLDSLGRRDTLPPRADLLRIAQTWSARPARRVEIVLDPAAVPGLVGVRRLAAPPAPVSADAADLARRVSAVLGLLVDRQRREVLLRRALRPRLARLGGAPVVVPPEHLGWLDDRAVAMREGLLGAGYAVHGDPDLLLPRTRPGAVEPSDAGVLALALRLLLEGDAAATRTGGDHRHDHSHHSIHDREETTR